MHTLVLGRQYDGAIEAAERVLAQPKHRKSDAALEPRLDDCGIQLERFRVGAVGLLGLATLRELGGGRQPGAPSFGAFRHAGDLNRQRGLSWRAERPGTRHGFLGLEPASHHERAHAQELPGARIVGIALDHLAQAFQRLAEPALGARVACAAVCGERGFSELERGLPFFHQRLGLVGLEPKHLVEAAD